MLSKNLNSIISYLKSLTILRNRSTLELIIVLKNNTPLKRNQKLTLKYKKIEIQNIFFMSNDIEEESYASSILGVSNVGVNNLTRRLETIQMLLTSTKGLPVFIPYINILGGYSLLPNKNAILLSNDFVNEFNSKIYKKNEISLNKPTLTLSFTVGNLIDHDTTILLKNINDLIESLELNTTKHKLSNIIRNIYLKGTSTSAISIYNN